MITGHFESSWQTTVPFDRLVIMAERIFETQISPSLLAVGVTTTPKREEKPESVLWTLDHPRLLLRLEIFERDPALAQRTLTISASRQLSFLARAKMKAESF